MRPWSAARASIPASRTVLPGRVPCTLRVYDYAVSLCFVVLTPVRFPGVGILRLKKTGRGGRTRTALLGLRG